MAAKKIRKGKRKWYPIHAPKTFNEQFLGETFIYETEQLNNKHIKVNLMTLTGNPKKQNMNVFFKVTKVVEGKAQTKTLGLEMQPSSVKRLVRRGRSKVADSFLARTKKKQLIRIKPIVMTRTRIDYSVQNALRKKLRELLRETTTKYGFDTIINDIIHMRLQKFLKEQLTSISPVRSVDIKYLRYEEGVDDEEETIEESAYAQRAPKKKKEAPTSESMQSLKDEVEEALAADEEEDEEPEEEPEEKPKKNTKKKKSSKSNRKA